MVNWRKSEAHGVRALTHWAVVIVAALTLSATAACSSPAQKVEKYTASGLEYLEKGDLGRANVQFQNALKIDETHVPALVGLSKIMEQRQDYKAMFGILQRIVRLDPKNVDALVKLGKLYLIGSDEKQALDYAEKALALAPEDGNAAALKAAVLMKLDDEAGAVSLARKVLKSDPGNPEAVAVLAAARTRAKDNEGALAEVDKALKVNKDAAILHLLRLQLLSNLGRKDELRAGFKQLIALYPDTISYRQMFVNTLLKEKRLDEASDQLQELVRLQPGKVDPILDVVRIDYQRNGAESATKTFKSYVDAQPQNTELRFKFGHFLRQEGDLAGAEAIYKSLAAENSDKDIRLRARNDIAGIRLLQGKKDEARSIINDILAADKDNPEALLKLASLKVDAKDYDGAIADLRTVIDNKPDLVAAKLVMASAFEGKGDIDFATSQLAQAVEDSKKSAKTSRLFARFLMRHDDNTRAEQVLLDSLAVHPRDIDNLKLLAALRLSRQDWRGAEEAAKLIANVNSEEPSANRILGVALTGEENYSGAIDALSAANEQAPLAARPLATLVSAYVKEGRAGEAEKMLTGMIESNTDNYIARILLAKVQKTQNKMDDMEQTLETAMKAAPKRPEAAEALYRVLIAEKRYDDAEKMLNEQIKSAPDSDAFKVLRADLLITTGRREEALDIYSDILSRRPDDLLVSNNYASVLLDIKNDPQSLARALDVARVFEGSDNPYFLDTLGWAQFRNGKVKEAVATLEKAVKNADKFAEAQYHLGAAYLAAGRAADGRARLEKSLALAPDASFADKVRELLAKQK